MQGDGASGPHGHGHPPTPRGDEECLARLATVDLGRLGLSLAALPAVVPVHFRLDGDDVLFHTAVGSVLDAASAGAVVAFQADHFRPDGTGWTVLLQGLSTPAADVGADPGPAGDPDGSTGRRARRPLTTAPGPLRLLRLRPSTVAGLRWE